MFGRGLVEAVASPVPDEWFIRRVGAQKSHKVSTNVMMVLTAALTNEAVDSEDISRLAGLDRSTADACLELLRATGYLPSVGPVLRQEPPPPGVRATLTYLADTYNYPFERYERGRSDSDRTRMAAYSTVHPDEDRARAIPDDRPTLVQLPLPIADVPSAATASFLERVAYLLAIATVPTMTTPSPWPGQPLWRKTSPSGGSRHPTELYLQIAADSGARVFYADPMTRRVVALDDEMDIDAIERARVQCDSGKRVSLVVTSRFARNMYRYREPRTFRTVFLDVGHVIGTMRLAAAQLGLRVVHSRPSPIDQWDRSWGTGQFDEFPSVALVVTDEREST